VDSTAAAATIERTLLRARTTAATPMPTRAAIAGPMALV
jgi:hypothetical protein